MSKKKPPVEGVPSKEELKDFIKESAVPMDKREMTRVLGLRGQDKMTLRRMLREMVDDGELTKTRDKAFILVDGLPPTCVIEIMGLDGDGEMRAKPVDWRGDDPQPSIYVILKKRSDSYLNEGDRVLARIRRIDDNEYEARILKVLRQDETERILGTFKAYKGGGYVYPTDKKIKHDFFVPAEYTEGLEDGDLVVAEPLSSSAKAPRRKNPVKIVERLGDKNDPRLISLISIYSHSIPVAFPASVLAETEKMTVPDIAGARVDLRDIPLVTIDGADARDFDDAVFAEPDKDPKNEGGWHLMVAIADVSYYVRGDTALEKSAYERGNSTYFPDRVVPMLPEKLSNDLCSLRPHVNRACLAAHLWIDKNAKLIRTKFVRGIMRSAARLTYEQVESAHAGSLDEDTQPIIDSVIKPLFEAYGLLKKARVKRGALELDLPERRPIIDENGQVTDIVPRVRLESHQLIEEFMILANVAAAEALESKNAPCVYRIHDKPSAEKLEQTRAFLKEFGYNLPKGDDIHPKNINHILTHSQPREDKDLIHTVLLRTQSQAKYDPDNIGHFGLALERYAHFTSPIRRYADLLVHRSLVKAFKLGEGGLPDEMAENLADMSAHISTTERVSVRAEREANDRFTAQYLSHNIGANFAGKVSGVTRFGLFVTLTDSGADGIVPIRTLPNDYYIHDESTHALIGKDTGRVYRLAAPVIVKLIEADPLRGSTVFELVENGGSGQGASRRKSARRSKGGQRREPSRGKSGRGKRAHR